MFKNLQVLFMRNVKLFFTDKRRMIMTFFSPIVTVFIFILFGRYLFEQSVKGLNNIDKMKFADGSLLVGLMGMTTLTNGISLSVFMVQDSEKKIFNDFSITPIKTSTIRLSYLLFNCLLNIWICLMMFIIIIVYMALRGTIGILSGNKSLYVYLIIILGGVMNSVFFTFVFSYLKSVSAFSAISGALSSVSGFFIGAFIPLTILPLWLNGIATVIPTTQIVSLMKWVVFSDIDAYKMFASQYKLSIATLDVNWWQSLIYVLSFTVFVIGLSSALNFTWKKKR
ncbi:ABC transporter permease [Mycoplasmopsis felifaucium]|uniref:ABC transporter permease n=1 Tax=Mycoplasmopsis felifaucium TaxID=35768 RepID=UPI000480D281|nr:ABC transporter permease [Mycoplasmopsis felifaucium]